MRIFLKFLALIAAAAVCTALLNYPVWALVQTFADIPIHRVMHRVGMAVLAVGLVFFLRHAGLASRQILGYEIPRRRFISQMTIGFCAGLILMIAVMAAEFGLALRSFNADLAAKALLISGAQGLLTGIAVAFIEETFFRGAMFGAVRRESGVIMAVVLPSLVYAAAHFIGGDLKIPSDRVTFASGVEVVTNMFSAFATPSALIDSLLALFALGILLSLIRVRTGAIAGGIGLHAGAVSVIVTVRNTSVVNPHASMSWLVGSYDGVIGWMVLACIVVASVLYWRISATFGLRSRAA